MANPVFRSSSVFREPRGLTHPAPAQDVDPQRLEQMYSAPAATTRDTGRLTYDDVIMKTGGLLAVLVLTGAITWTLLPPVVVFPAAIVGLVLGLVNAFKKEPSPGLIVTYAAVQGVFLGGLSAIFEASYPGIAIQAVLATVATFTATLLLFRSGKVRATPKFRRFFLIAIVGYALFSLINLGLMVFGGMEGFGLRSMEVTLPILGTVPLGLIIGIVAVGLAAMSLIMDFDAIQRGVVEGAPAKFAWSAAFGLLVTLVWLYLEFLRLLAILRGND